MSEQVKNLLGGNSYNPDVLECLANLSNDEVFTPPKVVNNMLDMLPPETWSNPNLTFLDPTCKTGVFLREIAKRLIDGLADQIPDLQERLDHIFHKQLYGIAITELTALTSRRSLYCSKYANGQYSVSKFDTPDGNIRFVPIKHTWESGKCKFCGANAEQYQRDDDLETHAYEFIHTNNPEEIFGMKFDVIIGNPPYQLSVGNTEGNSSKARAIYHSFIENARRIAPAYLCMITPSRWMTRSVEGIPEEWIDSMLCDNHIKELHDYLDASQCFPGVEIKGGVNYFLWLSSYNGPCSYYLNDNNSESSRKGPLNSFDSGIVIRNNNTESILEKIINIEGNYYNRGDNFSSLVSPKDFYTNKHQLTSSWSNYSDVRTEKEYIKYYLNKSNHGKKYGFVSKEDIPKNISTIHKHRVYIPAAGGSGTDKIILGKPFYGEPDSVCSQTYLVIGYNKDFTKDECLNIIQYIKSRLFRYLVNIKKRTQNGPRMVYQFVPLQDFSKAWTDEELYEKYNLSEEEIKFIEENIALMGGD